MGWPPWSMLYMTAFSLPSSLEILIKVRRPCPACRVPCQLPVMSLSWAWSELANAAEDKGEPNHPQKRSLHVRSPDWVTGYLGMRCCGILSG